jgi:prepilin-type N-terminal cleavage/methylation domain-containing protein
MRHLKMENKLRGFTLTESLIALLLLSMGLLGAGALLLDGLHAHGDALRRMAATRLVQDMADRIRTNPNWASEDLPQFEARARALFPGMQTPASIEFAPAIGPATPDRYSIRLRWRGPRDDAGLYDAVTLHLLAQPVAG